MSYDGQQGQLVQQQSNGGANGAASQDAASSVQQPEYTLAGILHYLQSEWRRYEKDRNEWEIERAEMRARIALLEGERRGAENLKVNLMRRVKMLEYALKQERSKYLSSASTASLPAAGAPKHPAIAGIEKEASVSGSGRSSPVPRGEDSDFHLNAGAAAGRPASVLSTYSTAPNGSSTTPGAPSGGHHSMTKDHRSRDKSREYLKQCLQEISYLTSASTMNPLPDRAVAPPGSSIFCGPPRPKKAMLSDDAVSAPHFGAGETASEGGDAMSDLSRPTSTSDAGSGAPMFRSDVDQGEWDKVKSQAPSDAQSVGSSSSFGGSDAPSVTSRAERLMRFSKPSASSSASSAAGSDDDDLSQEGHAATNDSLLWKLKKSLPNHRSAIRAVAFDDHSQQQSSNKVGSELTLASASKDRTIKVVRCDVKPSSSSLASPPATTVSLRGHTSVVTALAISSPKQRVYSASMDSTLRVWQLPKPTKKPAPGTDEEEEAVQLDSEEAEGGQQALAVLNTGSEIVALTLLSATAGDDAVLASASADGSVKLYEVKANDPSDEPALLRTFDYFGLETSPAKAEAIEKERETLRQELGGLPVPTSICSVPFNLRDFAVGFSNCIVKTFSVETGKETGKWHVDQSYDRSPATQLNAIVCHPTVPLLFTVHEDKFLRIVNLSHQADSAQSSGNNAVVAALHVHQYGATGLDIDPAGLRLMTCGRDGYVRVWDITKLSTSLTDSSSKAKSKGAQKEQNSGAQGSSGDDDDDEEGADANLELSQEIVDQGAVGANSEGVAMIRFHRALPLVVTGGADGIVRLYG